MQLAFCRYFFPKLNVPQLTHLRIEQLKFIRTSSIAKFYKFQWQKSCCFFFYFFYFIFCWILFYFFYSRLLELKPLCVGGVNWYKAWVTARSGQSISQENFFLLLVSFFWTLDIYSYSLFYLYLCVMKKWHGITTYTNVDMYLHFVPSSFYVYALSFVTLNPPLIFLLDKTTK